MNNKLSRTALFDFHHFCVRFWRPTRYIQDFWWSQAETEISATAIKKSHRNLRCISSQTPSTRGSLPSEEKNFPYLAPGTSSVSYLLPFPPTPQLKNQKTSYWVRRIVIKARKFQIICVKLGHAAWPRVWNNKKDGIFKQGDFSARFHFRGPSFHLQHASEKQSARKSDLHVRTAKSQIVETLLVKEEVSRTINDKT